MVRELFDNACCSRVTVNGMCDSWMTGVFQAVLNVGSFSPISGSDAVDIQNQGMH